MESEAGRHPPELGAQVPGEDARDASGALNAPFLE